MTLGDCSQTTLSSRTTTPNVLSYPVANHPVPFDLLSRHGKLSAQALEDALAEVREASVQLLLVLLLARRNLSTDARSRGGGYRDVNRLAGQ